MDTIPQENQILRGKENNTNIQTVRSLAQDLNITTQRPNAVLHLLFCLFVLWVLFIYFFFVKNVSLAMPICLQIRYNLFFITMVQLRGCHRVPVASQRLKYLLSSFLQKNFVNSCPDNICIYHSPNMLCTSLSLFCPLFFHMKCLFLSILPGRTLYKRNQIVYII